MIESQIFRQSGVGSRAWYIHRIKIGYPAGKTGFTYLRADSGDDGKQLSFDEIKSSMSQLVAAGYVKKHGKPDAPRSDKYEVTSFGHRYLEEHKSELEQRPEPKITGAAQTGVEHHVPDAPRFQPSIPTVPAEDRPIDRVAKAGITLGQEIEKHKAAVSKSPDSDTPEPASITPDTIQGEYCLQCEKASDGGCIIGNHLRTTDPIEYYRSKANQAPAKESTPTPVPIQESQNKGSLDSDFTTEFRRLLGEIMIPRFAGQVTAKDILEHLEKSE